MSVEVAVIGGGISGLATAFALTGRGHRVVVLECQQRSGGNAISERIGGFLMEHGPSTINAMSEVACDVSNELGLDGDRVELGAGVRRRYLVGGGRLRAIATHPFGFLTSGYLSTRAKLRLLGEAMIRKAASADEETIADFFTRRFGREFAERVADPLVAGLYTGRAGELSMSVFPRLVELEREFGSITAGMLLRRWRGGAMPGSRLFSWRDGIATLPVALARGLGGVVHTGTAVRRLQSLGTGYRIDAGADGTFAAATVVIATQPHVAAGLLDGLDACAASAAGSIDAPPVAIVYLGFERSAVSHPLDGLGFMTPEAEGRSLIGAQFCSTMFAGRAPAGHVAVSGYFGGVRAPDTARLASADLIDRARSEFADLIGACGQPVVARVRHWPCGLPQYRLGHDGKRRDFESLPERRPGLFVTGNYLAGPSVAACLEQAARTAARVDRFLASAGEPAAAGIGAD